MHDYSEIYRDITSFSDPGTESTIDVSGETARIRMIRSGEDRDYIIKSTDGRIEARHNKKKYASLKSLLSSEEFADLRTFAATQRRLLAPKELDKHIDPAGTIIASANESSVLDYTKWSELAVPVEQSSVKILLLDGPAGVGKTSLIERMVFERACQTNYPPIFHITSKGRRLSNLPDAMGKTASDLDAKFRADHIPILARLNALQVAIDGFDELVQPDGYGNAWGALKDFVKQMGVNGPLVLAGRDTFFDQQGFQKHFDQSSKTIDFVTIRLQEVSESSAKQWLINQGWSSEDLAGDGAEFFKKAYTRRPFFLSQIAKFKRVSDIPAGLGSPQAVLVDCLLDREALLLEPVLPSVPKHEIKSCIRLVFEEMALDLVEREAETIPLDFLEFISNIAFEGIAPQEERDALVNKIGSVALLESVANGRELRFPHSEIQNYFLASAVANSLEQGKQLPSLRSASYGPDLIEAFADFMRSAESENTSKIIDRLNKLLAEEKYAYRQSANVGALLLASLVQGRVREQPLILSNIDIGDVRLFDELGLATLTKVSIVYLDACGADLSAIQFHDCGVTTLVVDDTTRFGETFPDVTILQIRNNGVVQPEHNRQKICNWLVVHSKRADESGDLNKYNDLPLVKWFDRLCRRFIRQHYIRGNDRDESGFLVKGESWDVLSSILADEGYLSVSKRGDTSGSSDNFYSVKLPERLLMPENDAAARRVRLRVIQRAKEDSGIRGAEN